MRNRLMSPNVIKILAVMFAAAVLQLAGTAVAEDSAETYIKDLDIRQKPMANVGQQNDPAPKNSKLSVVATLDRRTPIYKKGEDLTVNVKASEDCYVWVFDTQTSGTVVQIYPNNYDKKNFLAAGKTLSIPGKGSKYRLQVAPPSGTELITVLASKENIPLTAKLVDKFVPGAPFAVLRGTAETVSKDLAITLRRQGSRGDKWTTGRVAFRIK